MDFNAIVNDLVSRQLLTHYIPRPMSMCATRFDLREAIIEALQKVAHDPNAPLSADGIPLKLEMPVWIVRNLINVDNHGGRGPTFLDGDIYQATVAGIRCIGDKNRRASFLEPGSSFTHSVHLGAVFSSFEAANKELSCQRQTQS